MRQIFYFLTVCVFLTYTPSKSFGQISREKKAIMEREFAPLKFDTLTKTMNGMTWDQCGDLLFEKNGKQYWLAPFFTMLEPTVEYYRLFEIKLKEGYVKEVTTEMLGGYYPNTGFTNPIHYEDIDNDGIKDILTFNSAEKLYTPQPWDAYNVFFKGTNDGFIRKDIPGITDDKAYHHAHDVDDFDNDGDLDIAFQGYGLKIFLNDGNGNFIKTKINNYNENGSQFYINSQTINGGSFGLKFLKLEAGRYKQLLVPSSNQMFTLEFINNVWEPKLYAKKDPFLWKPNVHIGPEQVLEFTNPTRVFPDLIYRVTTYDTVPGWTNAQWLTKFFRNGTTKFDSIYSLNSTFLDTSYTSYQDPKVVDLNFDGYKDIFFKEDKFWGNNGAKIHPVNQRLWLNDGKNNFNPLNYNFSEESRDLIYMLVKSDSIKRINILMSERRLPYKNEQGIYDHTIHLLYNRIDTIAYPIKETLELTLCEGDTLNTLLTRVPVHFLPLKSNSNIKFSNTSITYIAEKEGSDVVTYKFGNDFFTSDSFKIIYTVKAKPISPTISMDSSGNLVSSALSGNHWYKDGVALPDTTQKIKPISSGIYTVKTIQNGCSSDMSPNFIYIKTVVNDLKADEFIKVYPNPTDDNFIVDYNYNNQSILKLYFYDLSGNLLFVKHKIKDGESIKLKHYSQGTYLVVLKDNDGNTVYSNKVIKN